MFLKYLAFSELMKLHLVNNLENSVEMLQSDLSAKIRIAIFIKNGTASFSWEINLNEKIILYISHM